MKNVILIKKERVKETYISLKTKTLERFKEETTKIALDWNDREK